VFHQQAVNEDISATDAAQEDQNLGFDGDIL